MSDLPNRVVIVDIDIPLGRMTVFLLKIGLAALPIAIGFAVVALIIEVLTAEILSKSLLP